VTLENQCLYMYLVRKKLDDLYVKKTISFFFH
jgi:hypothetical protein